MQADGHRTWGHVIYRTTYSSDEGWAELLRRLHFRMEETFKHYNGQDIFERFTMTVSSDPMVFGGADTPTISAHFRQWAESAFLTEEQPDDDAGGVDSAALHSVLHDAPAPPEIDVTKKGWVKLVSKFWVPIKEGPLARPSRHSPNVYEPIEGVTERDVGWMKVPYQEIMGEYHSGEEGLNRWRTEYRRPPQVVGFSYGE